MKIPATPIALAAFGLGMMIVTAAAADRDGPAARTTQVALQPAAASADVVEVVAPKCLLPGQIRSFGGLTMLTPRRQVTLAAADCVARGGEPITATAAAD
jgi:hypothetical protein